MADIKLRKTVKGTIKTINKPAVAADHMKNAFVRTKDVAENTAGGGGNASNSPKTYGAERIQDAARVITGEAAHTGAAFGKRAVKDVGSTTHQVRNAWRQARDAQRSFIRTIRERNRTIKTVSHSNPQAVKTAGQSTVKAAQKTVKSSRNAIKTAQQTNRIAIKTANQTATATIKTAQTAAKASQRGAQAARATAKATAATLKAAVKATVAAVKAVIVSAKALIAILAAGGWIAVVVVLIICMIGMFVNSCFGIFLSGGDSNAPKTLRSVIQDINDEYQTRIERIKTDNPYDELDMQGTRASWPEVLSVYAIRVTTDPENPQEVATMDDTKAGILKDIFWQMHEISFRTENRTEIVEIEDDDGEGGIIILQQEKEITHLYITVTHRTALELADTYAFTDEQKQQLNEMLAVDNQSLWNEVLYGIPISDGDDAIVAVALSQVGQQGGQPYWSWMGFGSRVPWCASFVSWCANECGYIDSGVCPKFADCNAGIAWFKACGQWQDSGYTPNAGDLIFFDPDGNGRANHVGIVERFENGNIYTVEGNCGDKVITTWHTFGSTDIMGYGIIVRQ